jgi:lipopolysaccharide transport system permease protein
MDQYKIEIRPEKTLSLGIREIWQKRELLYFFIWRDIKVKYKQTYLGVLWAVLQPLLMMCIFYLVFSRAFNIQTGKLPYVLYAFSGLLLWGFFSSGINNSSESMTGNSNIIRKIYFPRLIIPLSSLLVAFIDFSFGFVVLLVLLIGYHQPVSWMVVICFPLGIGMTFLSAFGMGCFLAALNVKYRDFRYLLPFTMQFLFFSSQVVYSIQHIRITWLKYLLYCLPFNGALEIFNYPMQPGVFNTTGVFISLASMFLFLFAGLRYFKKTELYFADLL